MTPIYIYIYIAINPEHSIDTLHTLQKCIEDAFLWNTKNMLLSNPGKTEVLFFTSRFTKPLNTLVLGDARVEVKEKVKNLGVIMDKNLSFSNQVNETCKKATLAIRSIGRIRKYLPYDGLKMLVNHLVITYT